ncbi:MAG: CoA-binding protein [Bacteroidia bacterium]|nr:CoA-binding protein [Bacteroidia bacterium]
MTPKKTLVLGASMNSWRYSNQAILCLASKEHPVIAVGVREGMVGDVPVVKQFPPDKDIDTVTFYLNMSNQEKYYDAVLALKPKRIIFNPGAENPEFEKRAEDDGIEVLEACTLTMLAVGLY